MSARPTTVAELHAEWLSRRLADGVTAATEILADEIAGLNVDAFLIGWLLGECADGNELGKRIDALRRRSFAPTPWCHGCGATTKASCECPPLPAGRVTHSSPFEPPHIVDDHRSHHDIEEPQ